MPDTVGLLVLSAIGAADIAGIAVIGNVSVAAIVGNSPFLKTWFLSPVELDDHPHRTTAGDKKS
jgi:hypothetical protein